MCLILLPGPSRFCYPQGEGLLQDWRHWASLGRPRLGSGASTGCPMCLLGNLIPGRGFFPICQIGFSLDSKLMISLAWQSVGRWVASTSQHPLHLLPDTVS